MSHPAGCRCHRPEVEVSEEFLPCGCGGAYKCELCGECLNHKHKTQKERKAAKVIPAKERIVGFELDKRPIKLWEPERHEPGAQRWVRVCPDGTETALNEFKAGTLF